MFFGGHDSLDGDKLEASLFEAADDVSDESALFDESMSATLFLPKNILAKNCVKI